MNDNVFDRKGGEYSVRTDEVNEQAEHVVDGEECGVHEVAVQAQRRVLLDHGQPVQHRLLVRPQRRVRQACHMYGRVM